MAALLCEKKLCGSDDSGMKRKSLIIANSMKRINLVNLENKR